MRITHIRLRMLRSHVSGYGHDAAEIEAALDPGDEPDEVAQWVRQRLEAELRHGAEGRRLNATLNDLIEAVARAEAKRDAIADSLDAFQSTLEKCKAFIAAAKEKGIEIPSELNDVLLPF